MKAQDAAAEDSVTRMAQTGETLVTDGEQRASSFATYPIIDTLGGKGLADNLAADGQYFVRFFSFSLLSLLLCRPPVLRPKGRVIDRDGMVAGRDGRLMLMRYVWIRRSSTTAIVGDCHGSRAVRCGIRRMRMRISKSRIRMPKAMG